ncbi:uncharacterized protein LOC126391199 [Epinephelus moara]|uniref:uncharacterized protein LOC126391199 n=1 Tax=Epinephelus moara TaxID=300413 RepID=UPI00214DF354|nr:uncharacterized protein LOC126391199 [Epinephelus moara]
METKTTFFTAVSLLFFYGHDRVRGSGVQPWLHCLHPGTAVSATTYRGAARGEAQYSPRAAEKVTGLSRQSAAPIPEETLQTRPPIRRYGERKIAPQQDGRAVGGDSGAGQIPAHQARQDSGQRRLQTQHPQALLLISGDFNHACPSTTLPTFTQYVSCHTRDNKTLDFFYANTKEAYHSSPLPPLGRADHSLVHLLPVYRPLVQREPATTRTVKRWSEEAEEALKDCFKVTV